MKSTLKSPAQVIVARRLEPSPLILFIIKVLFCNAPLRSLVLAQLVGKWHFKNKMR